jgi:hypothetical protein
MTAATCGGRGFGSVLTSTGYKLAKDLLIVGSVRHGWPAPCAYSRSLISFHELLAREPISARGCQQDYYVLLEYGRDIDWDKTLKH